MNKLMRILFSPVSNKHLQLSLSLMRIAIGILTIGHGIPKFMGGVKMWTSLGGIIGAVGIHFLPTFWGFLGACTEFFGGLSYVLGLGTRIASFCLIVMMIIAFSWHIQRGDPFMVYSFPLSLIIVYLNFMFIGSGHLSVDYYLIHKK